MRKDGIQTRKRKPKKAGNGTKPPQDSIKKDGHSSPGIDGKTKQTVLAFHWLKARFCWSCVEASLKCVIFCNLCN